MMLHDVKMVCDEDIQGSGHSKNNFWIFWIRNDTDVSSIVHAAVAVLFCRFFPPTTPITRSC